MDIEMQKGFNSKFSFIYKQFASLSNASLWQLLFDSISDIFLSVLLVLNGMYVFEEHIKKALGNDIKEKLMRYVMFGEPPLDAHGKYWFFIFRESGFILYFFSDFSDMTEKLRDYLVESLYYKIDETFLNQLETVLQDELLTRLQIIRESGFIL